VPAGARILARSDETRDLVFIVAGRARIVDDSPGAREVVYGEVAAGGHVGEFSAIAGGPRSASVVAVEPCLVAALPALEVERLLERHPAVAIGLIRELIRVIRLADLRITELITGSAVERVCRELIRRAQPRSDRHGPGWTILDLPTQEVLAGAAGTTRETVGKIFVQLSRAGVIRRAGRRLDILRPGPLAALAGMNDLAARPDPVQGSASGSAERARSQGRDL